MRKSCGCVSTCGACYVGWGFGCGFGGWGVGAVMFPLFFVLPTECPHRNAPECPLGLVFYEDRQDRKRDEREDRKRECTPLGVSGGFFWIVGWGLGRGGWDFRFAV